MTLLRPELSRLVPYNAGLTLDDVIARAGGKPIAKLASNENPAPKAPEVLEAARQAVETLHLYPDPAGRRLVGTLARMAGIPQDRVILGDGSEDLLNVLARCLLRPPSLPGWRRCGRNPLPPRRWSWQRRGSGYGARAFR